MSELDSSEEKAEWCLKLAHLYENVDPEVCMQVAYVVCKYDPNNVSALRLMAGSYEALGRDKQAQALYAYIMDVEREENRTEEGLNLIKEISFGIEEEVEATNPFSQPSSVISSYRSENVSDELDSDSVALESDPGNLLHEQLEDIPPEYGNLSSGYGPDPVTLLGPSDVPTRFNQADRSAKAQQIAEAAVEAVSGVEVRRELDYSPSVDHSRASEEHLPSIETNEIPPDHLEISAMAALDNVNETAEQEEFDLENTSEFDLKTADATSLAQMFSYFIDAEDFIKASGLVKDTASFCGHQQWWKDSFDQLIKELGVKLERYSNRQEKTEFFPQQDLMASARTELDAPRGMNRANESSSDALTRKNQGVLEELNDEILSDTNRKANNEVNLEESNGTRVSEKRALQSEGERENLSESLEDDLELIDIEQILDVGSSAPGDLKIDYENLIELHTPDFSKHTPLISERDEKLLTIPLSVRENLVGYIKEVRKIEKLGEGEFALYISLLRSNKDYIQFLSELREIPSHFGSGPFKADVVHQWKTVLNSLEVTPVDGTQSVNTEYLNFAFDMPYDQLSESFKKSYRFKSRSA